MSKAIDMYKYIQRRLKFREDDHYRREHMVKILNKFNEVSRRRDYEGKKVSNE